MPRSYGTTNATRYASAPAVGVAGDLYFNTTSNSLFVSNGTAWLPASGTASDEVYIGTTDPGASYELWYDTDATAAPPGASLPPGGAAGQVLTKVGSADGAADWYYPAATIGGNWIWDAAANVGGTIAAGHAAARAADPFTSTFIFSTIDAGGTDHHEDFMVLASGWSMTASTASVPWLRVGPVAGYGINPDSITFGGVDPVMALGPEPANGTSVSVSFVPNSPYPDESLLDGTWRFNATELVTDATTGEFGWIGGTGPEDVTTFSIHATDADGIVRHNMLQGANDVIVHFSSETDPLNATWAYAGSIGYSSGPPAYTLSGLTVLGGVGETWPADNMRFIVRVFPQAGPAGGGITFEQDGVPVVTGTSLNAVGAIGMYDDGGGGIYVRDGAVNNLKLTDMAQQTIKGRYSVGTGSPQDLTPTQTKEIIANFIATGTGVVGLSDANSGLVPGSPGGTSAFLRADGTWTAPAGGGGLTQEDVDDRVNGLLVAGTGITKSYDDTANTLTLGANAAASLIAGDKIDVTDNGNGTATVNVDMSEGAGGAQTWVGGTAGSALTIKSNPDTPATGTMRVEGGALELVGATCQFTSTFGFLFSGGGTTLTAATISGTATTNLATAPALVVTGAKTDDDVIAQRYMTYIETTSATAGTIANWTAAAMANDSVFSIEAVVTARQKAGAGTIGHGAAFKRFACFRDIAGTTTQIGTTVLTETIRDNAGWTCDFNISTNNVRLQVVGEASKTIMWHADITLRPLSI